MRVTASKMVGIMEGWVGLDRANNSHAPIIDTYNKHKPLARGYKVKYTDAYCATTISAAAIIADAVDMLGGTECGVEEYTKLFMKKGIWEEDGTITPEYGYIICYNWDKKTQPNDGPADHIGIVVDVKDGMIKVLEGNIKGKVGYREIGIGDGCIRGYAIPDYLPEEVEEPAPKAEVKDVTKYLYADDQVEVSEYISGPNTVKVKGKLRIVSLRCKIFDAPDFELRNEWYKIEEGYISAHMVDGWVEEPLNNSKWIDGQNSRWWYERLGHKYYKSCAATIDGKDYLFDRDGYLIMPGRLNDGGDVKYAAEDKAKG